MSTPQRKAYLTLINAMTKEEYGDVSALLREEGIDRTDAPGFVPNLRATPPTEKEWEERMTVKRTEPLQEERSA